MTNELLWTFMELVYFTVEVLRIRRCECLVYMIYLTKQFFEANTKQWRIYFKNELLLLFISFIEITSFNLNESWRINVSLEV